MEVYRAATGPPATLEEWGNPIGEEDNMSTDQTVEFTSTEAGRYYLLWIPEAAAADGGYSVAIGDIELST